MESNSARLYLTIGAIFTIGIAAVLVLGYYDEITTTVKAWFDAKFVRL
jgi:hypothetical protein